MTCTHLFIGKWAHNTNVANVRVGTCAYVHNMCAYVHTYIQCKKNNRWIEKIDSSHNHLILIHLRT